MLKLSWMGHKIVRKIQQIFLWPPTELEEKAIERLKQTISQIDSTFQLNYKPENYWDNNRVLIRKTILEDDARRFLNWEVIKNTMVVDRPPYIAEELKSLRNNARWSDRWQKAIQEGEVGLPEKYPDYPASSGTLIHHAYSLSQFEEKTRQAVENLEVIVEFGGGYGSMCRLIHNLGFQGTYIIFDLPEFCALQQFFLQLNQIKIASEPESNISKSVLCISQLSFLELLLKNLSIDLFIGMWSISETPKEFREFFLPLVCKSKNYLIGYQDCFSDVDNIEFFANWSKNQKDIEWRNWEIPHLPENSYLMGTPKTS